MLARAFATRGNNVRSTQGRDLPRLRSHTLLGLHSQCVSSTLDSDFSVLTCQSPNHQRTLMTERAPLRFSQVFQKISELAIDRLERSSLLPS